MAGALMRPGVTLVCLCSVGIRAYPHESERVKSEASPTRALLPNAVSALLPSDAERRAFNAPFEFKCKKQKFHSGKHVGGFHDRIGRLEPGTAGPLGIQRRAGIKFREDENDAEFTGPLKAVQAQVCGYLMTRRGRTQYVPFVRVTLPAPLGHGWELKFPDAQIIGGQRQTRSQVIARVYMRLC